MATKAVRYTQPLLGEVVATVGPLYAVPTASVVIRQNGVACTVYSSNAKAALVNPLPTGVAQGTAGVDARGTLVVYLEAGGGYDGVATVGGVASTFAIPDISPDVADVQTPIPTGTYAEPPVLASGVQYVTGSNGDDANTGLSWGKGKAEVSTAIAALPAGGGTVHTAAGTYVPFVIPANVEVLGPGGTAAIVQSATSGSTAVIALTGAKARVSGFVVKPRGTFSGVLVSLTAAPDAEVSKLRLDGTAATTNYAEPVQINAGCDRAAVHHCVSDGDNGATPRSWTGVTVTDSADVEIYRNTISGGRNRGIDVRSTTGLSTGAKVHHNTISTPALQGIVCWNSYANVSFNRIKSPTLQGVFISGDVSAGSTNNGSVVHGNTITSPGGAGIDFEQDVHDFACTGNTVSGSTLEGISLIDRITDGSISGNTIKTAASGSYGAITCHYFTSTSIARINIVGNVVRSATNHGIHLEDGADCHVAANIVTGCGGTGITADATNAAGTTFGPNQSTGNTTANYGGLASSWSESANYGLAYLSPAVRPSELANLETWLDADAIRGAADAAAVGTWYDLSGKGRNAVQATGANQPLYKVGIFNGRPVLRFDGTNDALAQVVLGSPLAQPYTIFVVQQSSAGVIADGVGASNRLIVARDSAQVFNANAGTAISSGSTGINDARSVLTIVINGASSLMRANGVQGATGNAGANLFAGLTLGNNYFNGGAMTGDIAEVAVFSRRLALTEIKRLERSFGAKWGVTVAA